MAHLSVVRTGERPDDADLSEADGVRRIAAGDRDSLAWLYRRYHRRLARFLARLTWRADIVDEAINDVFWVVWQSADRYRGDSRVSTWIMGIAYRCALKALRVHGRAPGDLHRRGADGEAGGAGEAELLDDPFGAHEVSDWLSKGLARLSPEQRAAIELAYGGGHSLDEIAAIMQCPVGTVKARMFHARARLRDVLSSLAQPHAGASPAAARPGEHDV